MSNIFIQLQLPQCDDFRSACEESIYDKNFITYDLVQDASLPFCEEAESSCCEVKGDDFKIVTGMDNYTATFGLYNECLCEFWLDLCKETEAEACDYAAQYCCGDYQYKDGHFSFLNSDTCYCDFYNYVYEELGHRVQPKALNINGNFHFCKNQFQDEIAWFKSALYDFRHEYEMPSLEAIYKGTNGKNWKNNAGWMDDEIDHCQWYGISCNDDGFVISIDLRDNNLSGHFPVYSRNEVDVKFGTIDGNFLLENNWIWTKYGLANLYNLETLDLADNNLTGTINYRPLYNLVSLTYFDVSGNKLSGEVDALVTPSLTYADFSNNHFTSMRRFEKYKPSPLNTLSTCDVRNNSIQNNAADVLENIPSQIEIFLASNNRIKGTLPESLDKLKRLIHFHMSSNYLSGSLPGFTASFETLMELDLSKQKDGAYFTGTLPAEKFSFQSLQLLNLADNRLTGSIPSTIGTFWKLQELDLSNNLLGSSIPSELGMLQGE